MASADVEKVLVDLVNRAEARRLFKKDQSAYLASFTLTEAEKNAFADLDIDALKATADFLARFSDAEAAIGAIWIKS